jgi:high-affinity iron transporter
VPHIELLGIYSTWQTLAAQLAVVVLLASGYLFNIRRARGLAVAPTARAEHVTTKSG